MTVDVEMLRTLTAKLVSAFAVRNRVSAADLPEVFAIIHAALLRLGTPSMESDSAVPVVPAVPIRKSVHTDHVVCLECGQSFKMLKRHLKTDHALSPEAYRQKWGLPASYPMVAPSYARTRAEVARKIGLGRRASV